MSGTQRKNDRKQDSPETTAADATVVGRDNRELIAARAYARYEERGREQGHDLEDWLEAERELGTRGGD